MKPTAQNHDYTIFFCSDKLHTYNLCRRSGLVLDPLYIFRTPDISQTLHDCPIYKYPSRYWEFFFATLCIFSDTCSFLSTNQEIQWQ